MNKNISKLVGDEKGVSLIITFFTMTIILIIVLSMSIILYSEIKVLRNIGNSVVSFYAADSGIEKILYYDRQVLSAVSSGTPCGGGCPSGQTCNAGNVCVTLATRGLCSIYMPSSGSFINPGACSTGSGNIYCGPNTIGVVQNTYFPTLPASPTTPMLVAGYSDVANGCNVTTCDSCETSFATTLDAIAGTSPAYTVTAYVAPNNFLDIKSNGSFNGTERQIEISEVSQY